MKKCHAKTFNCLSNFTILYGLCVLDIVVFFIGHYFAGVYLISIDYWPFFIKTEISAFQNRYLYFKCIYIEREVLPF